VKPVPLHPALNGGNMAVSTSVSVTELTFVFDSQTRKSWVDGNLSKIWKNRYPKLFDQQDFEQSISQPNNHFFEWLAAILLYEATGRLTLIEKYTCKNHPGKREKLKEIIGSDLFDWCCENDSRSPDLFVYSPTRRNDWLFCEVKGATDKIRDGQLQWFERFYRKTGRRGLLLNLSKLG
jgi:hypothetical protein